MSSLSPLALVTVLAASFVTALLSLWVASRMGLSRRTAEARPGDTEGIVFLFDGEELVDATPSARHLLKSAPGKTSGWECFQALFLPRFPSLKDRLSNRSDEGSCEVLPINQAEQDRLIAEWWGSMVRIRLESAAESQKPAKIDRISLGALERELEILRKTAELAPYLAWQETPDGQIAWANRAYLKLAEKLNPEGEGAWPLQKLFPALTSAQASEAPGMRRISVTADGKNRQWFECRVFAVSEGHLFFAIPADAVIHAEKALQNFIQTLSLTFAHLPTGLAIFDRKRQLTLFNPALTDLLSLPVDFLSARPTLNAFLNRMREKQMIPEPKDYKSWRQQMEDLETKAENGTYEEIWNLPGGQTYRVIGRPHPDGAVAFLFDDISAEVSLTRRFLSQIETGQAVMNSFDEAIAVFSPSGIMTTANKAYAALWQHDPTSAFGDIRLAEALCHWQKYCTADSGTWYRIREFLAAPGKHAAQRGQLSLKDRRRLDYRLVSLPGGMAMVGFAIASDRAAFQSQRGKIPWSARA